MAQQAEQRTYRDPVLAQIKALEEADRRKVIKTRARRARIRKEYVGYTIGVFNGHDYTNVRVTEEMVGRMFGKVAPRIKPTAQSRFTSISPRKMRQAGDLIRGLPVEEALAVLNFTPRVAAFHMAKTLKSAIANKLSLEGTANLNPEHLSVGQVMVGVAPTAKRIRFRSMGRIYRVRKRYCHLAIYLDIDERKRREEEARLEAASGKGKTPAKKTARKKTTAGKAAEKKTAKKKTAKKKTTAKKATKKKPTGKKAASSAGSKAKGKAAKKETKE